MLRPALKTLALVALLGATCAAAPAADEAGEVPFRFEKGYVIVAGKIKGKEPVEFIVSTGAERSTVDFLMAKKYELQFYFTGIPPVTGRNDRTVTFTKVPGVSVGPADASLDMFDGSTAQASQAVGREIFGTLGSDFFKGRAVQLDFGKRVMRFLDKAAAEALRGKGDAAVLRMTQREDMFKQLLTLPLVEKVMFNGKPAKLMLDTGVPVVVLLNSSAAKRLGFEPPPEKAAPVKGAVETLELGPLKLSGVPVAILPKGAALGERLGDAGALAGTGVLQNFVATFDFRDKVVILQQL